MLFPVSQSCNLSDPLLLSDNPMGNCLNKRPHSALLLGYMY